jgi:colicin import membrane protein
VDADWNEQAAKKAKDYLGFQSFSHAGLVDQLSSQYGDKFTRDQAEFGVQAAGL